MTSSAWNGDEELRKFQVSMAETDVKLYTDLLKGSSKWLRWDNAFFVWFLAFSIFEAVLCVWYIVHGDLWAISSGALVILNVFLAKLNRRTRRNRLENNQDWEAKRAAALEKLEQLDPQNMLVPEIIEEEPYP